jgi:protein-S-isoprenylcysteine O-methyltransferase Ste14
MHYLEHRIPPPVVGLVVAGGMWGVAHLAPTLQLPTFLRAAVALAFAAIGVAVAVSGIMSFRRARTTVNPLKPETSAALVSTGIYSVTRNPMYLGMVLGLLAWTVYLASIWSLVGPVVFALYITRFQIVPEERVLGRLFGDDFAEYRKRVRRWL